MRTPLIVIPLAIVAMAVAVLYASETERKVGELNYREGAAAKQLLIDMLTRARTLPVYATTGDRAALAQYATGARKVAVGLADGQRLSGDDAVELAALRDQQRAAAAWSRLAEADLAAKDVAAAVSRDTAARSDALVAFEAASQRYRRASPPTATRS